MRKLAVLFGMSENERKGFLFLLVLLGLIGITPLIYRFYAKRTSPADLMLISRAVAETAPAPPSPKPAPEKAARPAATLFPFDPNGLPIQQWQKLGFSERQAQAIKNYEAKGGRFRTKADVAKMYVIAEEEFKRIEPYITLPESNAAKGGAAFSEKVSRPLPKVHVMTDLSTADTVALKKIRGIGSVLASRIVKFREALGGFHRVDQVKEVYGISEEQFAEMEPFLVLGGERAFKKLAINKLSISELAKHPYLSWKEATLIVRYREQHGFFSSIADMEKIYALDADFLRKVTPYLAFDRP